MWYLCVFHAEESLGDDSEKGQVEVLQRPLLQKAGITALLVKKKKKKKGNLFMN